MEEKVKELGRPNNIYFDGHVVSWSAVIGSSGFAATYGIIEPMFQTVFTASESGEILSLAQDSGPLAIKFEIGANGKTKTVEIELAQPGDAVHIPGGIAFEVESKDDAVTYVCEYPGKIALARKLDVEHVSNHARLLLPQDFLNVDEKITYRDDSKNPGINYELIPVFNPQLGSDDRVLLDIKPFSDTRTLALVDGNPLEIEILEGGGKLFTQRLDVESGQVVGELIETDLFRGSKLVIEPGQSFYFRAGARELVLRDTCKGFNPAHEMPIEKFSSTFSKKTPQLGR